jgi:sugar phosphate isomerase/epimerase
MKVSCCAYSYERLLRPGKMKMEEFIDLCAEMNLDGTELTSYYFPKGADREYFKSIRRRAFLNGLDVSGTAVGNRFTVPAGPDHDKQIALVKTWIDNAVEIGAPCIRIFAGETPKGAMIEQARKWCIECIEECLKPAADKGVFLALENHGGIVTTSDQTLAIVEAIRSPWFGLNVDTGNFRDPDSYAAIERTSPYAVNVHLKTEVTSTTRGAAPSDYDKIARIFKASGYRGYLSLEYEAREDPRTGVPKHIKAILAAVARANAQAP